MLDNKKLVRAMAQLRRANLRTASPTRLSVEADVRPSDIEPLRTIRWSSFQFLRRLADVDLAHRHQAIRSSDEMSAAYAQIRARLQVLLLL